MSMKKFLEFDLYKHSKKNDQDPQEKFSPNAIRPSGSAKSNCQFYSCEFISLINIQALNNES
jgi:hypothetical protein